ncbi:MAG TPA: hypothetical protein PKW76_13285 [bacterium]|nr:hypothetical protein [bacterium]HPG46643.1 hypothetical protein [bacterium]HPM98824.1 hypothetical protein [bacterium]
MNQIDYRQLQSLVTVECRILQRTARIAWTAGLLTAALLAFGCWRPEQAEIALWMAMVFFLWTFEPLLNNFIAAESDTIAYWHLPPVSARDLLLAKNIALFAWLVLPSLADLLLLAALFGAAADLSSLIGKSLALNLALFALANCRSVRSIRRGRSLLCCTPIAQAVHVLCIAAVLAVLTLLENRFGTTSLYVAAGLLLPLHGLAIRQSSRYLKNYRPELMESV